MIRRRPFLSAMAALATPTLALAQGDARPLVDKSARLLVGFPPGGSADLMARALVPHLGAYASQVVVENKPGAGGRLALDALKLAEPDGATFAVTPTSMLSIYPHVYKTLGYRPQNDFVVTAAMASFPLVLLVGPVVPPSVRTVAEFVAWCKANPKQAAYATPGGGSTPHFAGAALARAAGVELLHVPYKGGAPAMTDLIGGQIAANMAVISNAMPMIQNGKARALAVTGAQRASALPQVPTMAEAGYPDVLVNEWFVVLLPSRASAAHVARLHDAVVEAMKTPAMKDVLAKAAFDPMPAMSAQQVSQLLDAESARWEQVVKATGYTPQD